MGGKCELRWNCGSCSPPSSRFFLPVVHVRDICHGASKRSRLTVWNFSPLRRMVEMMACIGWIGTLAARMEGHEIGINTRSEKLHRCEQGKQGQVVCASEPRFGTIVSPSHTPPLCVACSRARSYACIAAALFVHRSRPCMCICSPLSRLCPLLLCLPLLRLLHSLCTPRFPSPAICLPACPLRCYSRLCIGGC